MAADQLLRIQIRDMLGDQALAIAEAVVRDKLSQAKIADLTRQLAEAQSPRATEPA